MRRWFLEQLAGLRTAIDAKDADNADDQRTSATVAAALIPARAARNALVGALERAAAGDDEDEAALDVARGSTVSAPKMLKSLNTLAKMANDLLGTENEERRIAVREAALQPRLVTAARESAAQLQRALDDETAVGRKTRSHQDSPQMNIVEGRTTLSLRRMRGVYNSARAEHRALPALEIPDALTLVLRSTDPAEVVEEPIPEPVA